MKEGGHRRDERVGKGRRERGLGSGGEHCYRECVSRKEGTMTEDERMKSERKTLREGKDGGSRGRRKEGSAAE